MYWTGIFPCKRQQQINFSTSTKRITLLIETNSKICIIIQIYHRWKENQPFKLWLKISVLLIRRFPTTASFTFATLSNNLGRIFFLRAKIRHEQLIVRGDLRYYLFSYERSTSFLKLCAARNSFYLKSCLRHSRCPCSYCGFWLWPCVPAHRPSNPGTKTSNNHGLVSRLHHHDSTVSVMNCYCD